jgi:hypothetical protein
LSSLAADYRSNPLEKIPNIPILPIPRENNSNLSKNCLISKWYYSMSRNFAPDQTLIDNLRSNDTEAFEELFRRYWYNLYIYSLKKLRSSDDSRRIVRDIFKELWEERQSWPANFSLPRHLYAEVRKAVIKSLSQKLNAENNSPVITEEILPGFSVTSLQQARMPVMKMHAINKPAESIKQQTIRRKSHSYSTIANMKWLFNVVTARLN